MHIHGLAMRRGELRSLCGTSNGTPNNTPKNIGLGYYKETGKSYVLRDKNLKKEVTCPRCVAFMNGGKEAAAFTEKARAVRWGRECSDTASCASPRVDFLSLPMNKKLVITIGIV